MLTVVFEIPDVILVEEDAMVSGYGRDEHVFWQLDIGNISATGNAQDRIRKYRQGLVLPDYEGTHHLGRRSWCDFRFELRLLAVVLNVRLCCVALIDILTFCLHEVIYNSADVIDDILDDLPASLMPARRILRRLRWI